MAAALNIAALSRRTGVAPDTLRKWEQRYGILRPTRTAGGQRRYSELDVQRVEWLKGRLAEGYRIGEAARLLAAAGPTGAGESSEELRDAMVAAVRETDLAALFGLLDQALTLFPVERALDEIVQPALEAVGRGWEEGRLSVAQEHLASESVRSRLERLLADVRGAVRGVAVLACVPGERHELGLLMLAVLLHADGWQVAYLGADTPLADAIELAQTLSARFLGLSVAMADRSVGLDEPPALDGVALVLGGRAASAELAEQLGARYLAGDVRTAVRELRGLSA